MANYYATTRSNYFRVKDAQGFERMCAELRLDYWTKAFAEHPGDIFYAISNTGDGSGWPDRMAENDDDAEDIEVVLTEHLDPRDVAILLEVGSEKLRYLVGYAVAIHATKPSVHLNISMIADKAREAFGDEVTITDPVY